MTVNIPGLVVETETFWLHCNSSHPGKPVGVQWFHNDSLVPTSGRFLSLSGALSIFRPTMSDMGPWRCNLAYSDGANVSATYNLQILGKPSIHLACLAPLASAATLSLCCSCLPFTISFSSIFPLIWSSPLLSLCYHPYYLSLARLSSSFCGGDSILCCGISGDLHHLIL